MCDTYIELRFDTNIYDGMGGAHVTHNWIRTTMNIIILFVACKEIFSFVSYFLR